MIGNTLPSLQRQCVALPFECKERAANDFNPSNLKVCLRKR